MTSGDNLIVGSKAANLAYLLEGGFPVPDGVVLTTETFAASVDENGLGGDSTAEAAASASLPEDLTPVLADILTAMGSVPLAVRSSSVTEDLPDSSFASQYETVLDVSGLAELERAVLRCWASAFSTQLAVYRDPQKLEAAPMAILIQPMVDAEASGVAFSANPVTGRRDEIVINAVRGIGNRLVSGEVSPDEWVVIGEEASCEISPEGAIDLEQASAIADLTRTVESHFDRPQDIEWAIDGKG